MTTEELKFPNEYMNEIVNMHSLSIWESLDDYRRQATTKNEVKERARSQLVEAIERNQENNIIIISKDENIGITGFIWIELVVSPFSGERTGHVVDIHVKENCRRNGIASSLIVTAQEKMSLLDVVRMTLNVSGDNYSAQRLYEKKGFSTEMLRMMKRM
jgi:ribosomal protein S18 acetylase RimI-like enzyme